MEANARVLLLVLDAMSQCDDVMINLQPSVDGHPVFTDFCFMTRHGKRFLSLIEAKSVQIYTDLRTETQSTAQVLREAHILMCKDQCLAHLHIVLINSLVWSFGLVERAPHQKIMVTKHFHLPTIYENLELLVQYLKSVVHGM